MAELVFLALFAALGAFWFDSRRVQEIAVARARRACEQANVQLLDDIAPVWRVKLQRDAEGVLRLRRMYTFDYSDAGGERRSGSIVMLGRFPVAIQLENHDVLIGESRRLDS